MVVGGWWSVREAGGRLLGTIVASSDQRPTTNDQPPTPTTVFVDVNGIRLAYSDSGTGEPVLLLVHGFPLNRSMWDPQLGRLRGSGARVIAPDLRGYGASEAGPPGP